MRVIKLARAEPVIFVDEVIDRGDSVITFRQLMTEPAVPRTDVENGLVHSIAQPFKHDRQIITPQPPFQLKLSIAQIRSSFSRSLVYLGSDSRLRDAVNEFRMTVSFRVYFSRGSPTSPRRMGKSILRAAPAINWAGLVTLLEQAAKVKSPYLGSLNGSW